MPTCQNMAIAEQGGPQPRGLPKDFSLATCSTLARARVPTSKGRVGAGHPQVTETPGQPLQSWGVKTPRSEGS